MHRDYYRRLANTDKILKQKLREAYKAVEEEAGERLLSTLPDDLREEYEKYFVVQDGDEEIWKIVKSADRLSALIKCIDERRMGNMEFCKAEESTRKIIEENMTPELAEFIKEFMPSYGMTLDEQIKNIMNKPTII